MIIQFSVVGLNLSSDGSTVSIKLQSAGGDTCVVSLASNNPAIAQLTIGRLVNVQFTVV